MLQLRTWILDRFISTKQRHKCWGLDLEMWPNAPEWARASWSVFWDLEVRMHSVWMQDWSLKRALPGHLHSQGSPWQRNLPQKQHQCPTVMSSLEPPPMNKASACFYSSFPLFLGQDIGLKGGLTATFLCTFLPVDNTLVTRKKPKFLPWFHVLLDMLKSAITNPSRWKHLWERTQLDIWDTPSYHGAKNSQDQSRTYMDYHGSILILICC